jgi:iron-sulfur cluster assembly accessory protein
MSVKVEVSKEAESQVKELIRSQKPGTAVRIFVQSGGGGGCGSGCGCGAAEASGPAYGLSFDRPRNGDEVIPIDGFSIVVDPTSAEQVNGARLDYVQGLDQSGFTIVSPNSPPSAPVGSGCGCGSGGGGGCGSGGGGGCC